MDDRLDGLDDSTLFEVFEEMSNQLNVRYVSLRRRAHVNGNDSDEAFWLSEARRMLNDRYDTGADDRERQKRLIREWEARYEELRSR